MNILSDLRLKNNTRQMSSIKTDALVHFKTLLITRSNMADGMALISSEILCLRLC